MPDAELTWLKIATLAQHNWMDRIRWRRPKLRLPKLPTFRWPKRRPGYVGARRADRRTVAQRARTVALIAPHLRQRGIVRHAGGFLSYRLTMLTSQRLYSIGL